MQTNCPQCSNRLVLDDAKIPDTPFMLKCPKCQNTIKLPGRNEAPPPAGQPVAAPPQAAAPLPQGAQAAAGPPAAAPGQVQQAQQQAPPPASRSVLQPPAPIRPPSTVPTIGKALVSFPAPDPATALGTMLARLGFESEPPEPQLDERILRLQQGEYPVVATSRNGVPEDRDLYRFVRTLPPEIRRRVFLILVGDEFKTGEGNQAFAVLADLVVHSNDAANCERLVAQTMIERRRIYQTLWDAEDRKAQGKL